MSSFFLNTSGDSTTILGSPFQYLITLPVKNFFLMLVSACAGALPLATRACSQEKAADGGRREQYARIFTGRSSHQTEAGQSSPFPPEAALGCRHWLRRGITAPTQAGMEGAQTTQALPPPCRPPLNRQHRAVQGREEPPRRRQGLLRPRWAPRSPRVSPGRSQPSAGPAAAQSRRIRNTAGRAMAAPSAVTVTQGGDARAGTRGARGEAPPPPSRGANGRGGCGAPWGGGAAAAGPARAPRMSVTGPCSPPCPYGFRFRAAFPVPGARLSGAARLAGRAAPWRESKVRARRGEAGNGGRARPRGEGPGRAGPDGPSGGRGWEPPRDPECLRCAGRPGLRWAPRWSAGGGGCRARCGAPFTLPGFVLVVALISLSFGGAVGLMFLMLGCALPQYKYRALSFCSSTSVCMAVTSQESRFHNGGLISSLCVGGASGFWEIFDVFCLVGWFGFGFFWVFCFKRLGWEQKEKPSRI